MIDMLERNFLVPDDMWKRVENGLIAEFFVGQDEGHAVGNRKGDTHVLPPVIRCLCST